MYVKKTVFCHKYIHIINTVEKVVCQFILKNDLYVNSVTIEPVC